MSVIASLPLPRGWGWRRLDRCFTRTLTTDAPNLPPLSVFLDSGVVPRASRSDNHNELGDDLSRYLVVAPEDLVFNKLRTWQGGFGRSAYRGIVSPAYFVCRPSADTSSRYVDYLLHASPYLAELVRISKWQPPSQFDTPWEQLKLVPLLCPPPSQQSAIADFLDGECDRIADVQRTTLRLSAMAIEPALELAKHEFDERRLGRIGYRFEVQLGKMLDEKQIDRGDTRVYLRNANIHWDEIRLEDLKEMTFDSRDQRRFALRPGDLLVCEGGEPGRAAVWGGELSDCYYQKALHRVRPYENDSTRYLLWALRVLSNRKAFAVDGPGRYTHLTAEMLRAVRVPMPPAEIQHERAAQIDGVAALGHSLARRCRALTLRLAEYRDALITETVTGQFDIVAPSDAEMDERLHEAIEASNA